MLQDIHITVPQLREILSRTDPVTTEPGHWDAHLSECRLCRGLLREEIRQSTAAAAFLLPSEEAGGADEPCLTEDVLVRLASGEAAEDEEEEAAYHLAWCDHCRAGLENLQEFHQEMLAWMPEQLTAAVVAAPAKTVPAPQRLLDTALENGLRWLVSLREQAVSSLETLRAPMPAYGFAEAETPEPRQELHFAEDSALGTHLLGSYRREQGHPWIHLEHPMLPAGSLLFLEIADTDGASLWRRFVILRKGFRHSVAEARLDAANLGEHRLRVTHTTAAALPPEAAPELETSFAAAVQENPVLREVWQAWAAQAARETSDAVLTQTLARIARP